MPPALRQRLGEEASVALMELLDRSGRHWRDSGVELALERFDRRLVEEVSVLRVELAQGLAALREENARGLAALREEIAKNDAALRAQMAEGLAELRSELHKGLAETHNSLLRWSMLFWTGQLVALAALLRFLS